MPRRGYLQIKVSTAEHDTLRRLAAESQVTVSDWIRGAILAKTMQQKEMPPKQEKLSQWYLEHAQRFQEWCNQMSPRAHKNSKGEPK